MRIATENADCNKISEYQQITQITTLYANRDRMCESQWNKRMTTVYANHDIISESRQNVRIPMEQANDHRLRETWQNGWIVTERANPDRTCARGCGYRHRHKIRLCSAGLFDVAEGSRKIQTLKAQKFASIVTSAINHYFGNDNYKLKVPISLLGRWRFSPRNQDEDAHRPFERSSHSVHISSMEYMEAKRREKNQSTFKQQTSEATCEQSHDTLYNTLYSSECPPSSHQNRNQILKQRNPQQRHDRSHHAAWDTLYSFDCSSHHAAQDVISVSSTMKAHTQDPSISQLYNESTHRVLQASAPQWNHSQDAALDIPSSSTCPSYSHQASQTLQNSCQCQASSLAMEEDIRSCESHGRRWE